MKYELETLGNLKLQGSTFQEPLALVLLSYLASEGECKRIALADLLWPHAEAKKRSRSMAELIYRINKTDDSLLKQTGSRLSSSVFADFKAFEAATEREQALELYKGEFLPQIEFNRRLRLGQDLTEWLMNKREQLAFQALNWGIKKAEALAYDGAFEIAAEFAWQSYLNSKKIAYPDKAIYERLHKLFLAADKKALVRDLEKEAKDLYEDFQGFTQVYKARSLLSHTVVGQDDVIGRDEDLRKLDGLVSDHALVSLHGPAGIGKTSLAKAFGQVARGKPYCHDGLVMVYFEQLDQAASETEIIGLIASALALAGRECSLETLYSELQNKRFLLILDNLEHILVASRKLIKDLLAHCPDLKILISSREVLNLEQEYVFTVMPLSYPEPLKALDGESFKQYSALQLFQKTAHAKGQSLNNQDLTNVVKVCSILGGMPLAIKLAAAWTTTLSLEQIVRQVESSLDLLNFGPNERHVSIRAAFTASLTLLDETDLACLLKMGVFEGSFDFEAALIVVNANPPLLRRLVEKSLLRFDPATARYSFHPLLDRYIKERFSQSDFTKTLNKHKDYYFGELNKLIGMDGVEVAKPLDRLFADLGNIEKAWRYATASKDEQALFIGVRPLSYFARGTGRYRFAETLVSYSLNELEQTPSPARTALCTNLATLKYYLCEYEASIELARSALDMLAQTEIEAERKLSIHRLILGTLEVSYSCVGDFDKCLKVAYEHIDLLKEKAPASFAYAQALTNLAISEREILGKPGLDKLAEADEIFNKSAEAGLPFLKVAYASAYIMLKDYDQARHMLNEAIHIGNKLGQTYWVAYAKYSLAELSYLKGELKEARESCEALLEDVNHLRPGVIVSLELLIANCLSHEQPSKALVYFDLAQAKAEKIANPVVLNSVKIDRLAFLLNHNLGGADELREELEKETGRMYVEDKEKFLILFNT